MRSRFVEQGKLVWNRRRPAEDLPTAREIYHAMCTLDLRGRRQQVRRKQRRILLVSLLVVLAARTQKPCEISHLID
jgi:hypothetical protein